MLTEYKPRCENNYAYEWQPINISVKFFILHSWVLDNSGAWEGGLNSF